MQLNPTFDHVLVEVTEEEHVRASGLIVTDTSLVGRLQRAKVLKVGPGMYQNGVLIPVRIQKDSYVHYMKNQGIELEKEGAVRVVMIREGDIVGTE